jgi:hypothetical protein
MRGWLESNCLLRRQLLNTRKNNQSFRLIKKKKALSYTRLSEFLFKNTQFELTPYVVFNYLHKLYCSQFILEYWVIFQYILILDILI